MNNSPFVRVWEDEFNSSNVHWVNLNFVETIDVSDNGNTIYLYITQDYLKGCFTVVDNDCDKVKKYLGMEVEE